MIRYNTTLQIPGQPFQSIVSAPAADGYWVKASEALEMEVRIKQLEQMLMDSKCWEYRYNGLKSKLDKIKHVATLDD